jgi:hypothetical protein
MLQRGYSSAAHAYNIALETAQTDLVLFAHQDVYLPEGWFDSLERSLDLLSVTDPRWGVLGVWGITNSGLGVGYLYCAGVMRTLGEAFDGVAEVQSLDEVLLIVRKGSGIRFDEHLPGFHLYGTDICLEARRRGMKCYAISSLCVHNTNGYDLLPLQFWRNCLFIRRKWKSLLPITTSCITITYWCWPMIWWNINRAANLMLRRHHVGRRVQDPRLLYRGIRFELRDGAA